MMMQRRRFLALGAGGIAMCLPAMASAARGRLPDRPCTLTRRLDRILLDGKLIRIDRSWKVGFANIEDGFVVQGEQIGVTVQAPPALQALAEIESARQEQALFPLYLDSQGLLRSAGSPSSDQASVDQPSLGQRSARDGQSGQGHMKQALDAAEAIIAAASASADDKAQARAFASALDTQAAGMLSRIPNDLFFPAQPHWTESRQLALPGGGAGQVTVHFDAQTNSATGLLKTVSRTVTTTIGTAERVSREAWTLTSEHPA